MARREFLQLAKTYRPGKDKIAGWYISEKCDGTRCFWDGGASRGMRTEEVPYASVTDPKTGKRKAKIKPFATGLWSRYGNPIMAPDWFLDSLPRTLLDGELWAGRGKFQLCRSICGGDTADPRFDQIRYAVYSAPPLTRLTEPGDIKNANFHTKFGDGVRAWLLSRVDSYLVRDVTFEEEYEWIRETLKGNRYAFAHPQMGLPDHEQAARTVVEDYLTTLVDNGGEGVVIRDPDASWMPKRVGSLLKYKPFLDDEAVIVGFTSGRETDRGSKHLGKIGAIITNYKGKRLELSGLTDEEREFANPDYSAKAAVEPGRDMPFYFQGKHFRTGQTVTFRYRELSDDGIPKEARLWRKREVE